MVRHLKDFGPGFVLLAAVLTNCVALSQPGLADDKVEKPGKAAQPAKERAKTVAKIEKAAVRTQAAATTIPPEREVAVLAFAAENHPELASLLEGLKRNAPKEYQAALTDLNRAVERLEKVKEKSPDRLESDLADWKMTSRIRLLAARLTMSPDPAVEAELRAALRARLETRLAAQRAERDRMQVRVAKLDQQIEEMASKADEIVEKQFVDLKKTLPARPAAKAKPKKTAPEAANAKGETK